MCESDTLGAVSSGSGHALRATLVAVAASCGAFSACGRSAATFDLQRARAHVDELAQHIGVRPIGSAANRQAREYIAGVLQAAGMTVRLQETDAIDAAAGLTAHVVNIIATKDGSSRDAIALMSHYDSVPDGPGAGDDALGVATCMESARVLIQGGLQHSLFVIVTDGEEAGLMGARAAIVDPDVATRVKSFLNFDGTSDAGAPLLYETAPGWSPPLTAWAHGAEAPRGASFAVEIYRRLPNDTDFTIFKTIGAAGLNFAPVADSYAYHNDRDAASRVDPGTLAHEIVNTISTVRALDVAASAAPASSPTYFDLAGRIAVLYGESTERAVLGVGLILAAIAMFRVVPGFWCVRRLPGVLATIAWAIVATIACLGSAMLAAVLLRAVRTEMNFWYAAPSWFFLFVIAAGMLGVVTIRRLSVHVPESLRPVITPAAVWSIVLPLWTIGAIALHGVAPGASYLIVWPLVVASLACVGARTPIVWPVGAFAVLVTSSVLWIGNSWTLLQFMVPLFGWLPVSPPLWLFPVTIAAASVALVPPILVLITQRSRNSERTGRASVAILLLTIAAGVAAWAAPAFTQARPQVRIVRFVQDDRLHQAWWEIGGSEPALDLGKPGPSGASWQPVDDGLPASVRIAPLPATFRFRTAVPAGSDAPPAHVESHLTSNADGTLALDIKITPLEPLTFRLVLPTGVLPVTSSLAGVTSGGAWRATYVAPPSTGTTVHLTFRRRTSADLASAALIILTPGVPGSRAGAWPAWLLRERATWKASSLRIVSLGVGE